MVFQQLSRLMVGLILVAGLTVTVGGPIEATGASPIGADCVAGYFQGGSTVSSRPGGTTVRIVLTSHRFPSCAWSGRYRFSFLSSTGSPIGPEHRSPTVAPPVTVYDTFQVVQSITVMEGVRCTAKVATRVSVSGPGGGRLEVPLPHSVGVCINGTVSWATVDTTMFPMPSICKGASLKLALGPANGAAGTVYYPLRWTNTGSLPCTLSGIPRVQPASSSMPAGPHHRVGPPAKRLHIVSSGYGDPIRLVPGGHASAAYGVVDTGNLTPSACVARNAQSLLVTLAGVKTWSVTLHTLVCTKLASTSVTGLVPTGSGTYP